MDRKTVIQALERVKASENTTLGARLAPELATLETAVLVRLITWRAIAGELGVSVNTLATARRGAAKLRAEWIEKGLISSSGEMVETAVTTAEKPVEKNADPAAESPVEEVQENEAGGTNPLAEKLKRAMNK